MVQSIPINYRLFLNKLLCLDIDFTNPFLKATINEMFQSILQEKKVSDFVWFAKSVIETNSILMLSEPRRLYQHQKDLFEAFQNPYFEQKQAIFLQEDEEVKNVLRENDTNVNVNWPLAHYKSAVRYLARDASDIAATGGTNWQKYLPPRFQKRIFYPEIWTEQEHEDWGKGWVETNVFRLGK